MLRVGLTGGIASGKSEAVRCLTRHGAAVIDTDLIARELVAPGAPALADIAATFGDKVLHPDGSLDRAALRKIVFTAPAQRHALEALLHPLIRDEAARRLEQTNAAPCALLVVPLLVEHLPVWRPMVDRILLVDCPEALQTERLLARDNITPELARAMLSAQTSRAIRRAAANDIVYNDASPGALCQALDQLWAGWNEAGLLA